VASNPEFLKEGAAIEDFQKPDRVVVGVRSAAVGEILRSLYKPFLRTEHPFLVMAPESSEMTKYVANSLLATKISFINEVANLCERMEADIDDVRRGIGHDKRIGFSFLFPGVGYGGSCFPKDVQALAAMARDKGVAHRILTAVHETNLAQKQVLGEKIVAHFGGQLAGRRIAVWGLAFKPRTDDVRDAPSLDLLEQLLAGGAQVTVYDPEAMAHVRAIHGDRLTYASGPMEALDGAESVACGRRRFLTAGISTRLRRCGRVVSSITPSAGRPPCKGRLTGELPATTVLRSKRGLFACCFSRGACPHRETFICFSRRHGGGRAFSRWLWHGRGEP
jgi:UDPglucose 6-dehydrogenase